MGPIDIAIVGGFVLYAIASGLWSSKAASRNMDEYFLAGRTLAGWRAGVSMAATQFAADTPLLVTGLIATGGIFALWRLWIYAIAFLFMGFVLAPSWRRASVLTDAELTEVRYSGWAASTLRAVKAIYFGTIFNCTVLAMVLLAATRIAEPFLLWNRWLPASLFDTIVALVRAVGVQVAVSSPGDPTVWVRTANNVLSLGAVTLLTLFYSTTGGLRSVVRTDVAQFFIAMFATAAYAWFVVRATGGLGAMLTTLHERLSTGGGIEFDQVVAFTPSHAKDASLTVLAVIGLQWLVQMNADGTGYLAQRSMACRTDRDASLAAVLFAFAQVFFRSLLWIPIGLGLLVLYPPNFGQSAELLRADREATYVRGMADLLPTGVLGLALTGMLAALASTVDTHLNWGASYWTNDLYARFYCRAWRKREPSPRALVRVARTSNALILVVALIIMTHLDSIQTAWRVSLLLGAGMGVMLVLRWLWWRINAWGELTCVVVSTLLAPALLAWVRNDAERMLVMALATTVAGILASLLTRPDPMNRLVLFYERARPPGFWGPVAVVAKRSGGDDLRRLARQLAATFLGAMSLFALLTGVGTWLFSSHAPTWCPWRGVWIAALLIGGSGLLPVWWRLGLQATPKESEPG